MQIRNWKKHQHYKGRRPPWVKLYRDLLDDEDFHLLSPQATKTLVLLWLLASEDETMQGLLPSKKKTAFRLRMTEKLLESCLSELSHWVIYDASTTLATRKQLVPSETEDRDQSSETRVRGQRTETRKTSASASPHGGEKSEVWNAYSDEYKSRYGVLPIRNAKVNSCLKSFMSRVPEKEAPDIASFYVRHPGAYYVSRGHPVELLLRDAEKIRTEWANNRPITQREAQQSDGKAARGKIWQELIDEAEAKKGTA